MNKKMLIDASQKKVVRVAMIENGNLIDYESEKIVNERIKGNIYLAKIVRVNPHFKQLLSTMVATNMDFWLIMKYILTTLKYLLLIRKN